jgi:RNA polymerase sigma-70 factor (ECF subfamily)
MNLPGNEELHEWSLRAIELGQAAFPGVEVSQGELLSAVRARLLAGEADQAAPALDTLDAAELYVACACVRGDRVALAALRRRYFEPLARALARMGLGAAQRDDVWQELCEQLAVQRERGPAKIMRYAGGGKMAALVRVAATRLGLRWLRQERRKTSADQVLADVSSGHSGPELHLMKEELRTHLKQEVEAAIASLDDRDRMLLRLNLLEHVSIDRIAQLSGTHRATAARWVARAKQRIAERVRARLAERWPLDESGIPVVRTLIDSHLDLSLGRLLESE